MANPQPLILTSDRSEYLLPHWNDTSGMIVLSAGQSMTLYCPNGIKNFDTKHLSVTCIGGKYFQIGTEKYQLKNVRCQKHPWITLLPAPLNHTRSYCTDYPIADIGFRVDDKTFLKTMSICHDVANLQTFFAIYQLRPFNLAYQKGVGRLSFIQAREFNYTASYQRLYSKENQRKQIENVLGSDEDVDDYFDTDKLFLSRGHLGGKVDFFDRNHQRSSFFYVNTAPQFQSINGGNWLRVEDGIRRYVAKKMFNATIISGTHGILRFPSLADEELFLGEKRQLPVPQYFYKIVYDEDSGKGIVFISVNNPHIEEDQVLEYIFCRNISDEIKWVSTRDSIIAGIIFACDVNEFLQQMTPNLLPKLNVTGLLL